MKNRNRTLIAISVVVVLAVVIAMVIFFPYHKTNDQLYLQGSKCNITYLIADNSVFCFRGNWNPSSIPAIQKASAGTGVKIITGPGIQDQTQMIAVYIEDVKADLSFFWDATGLFK